MDDNFSEMLQGVLSDPDSMKKLMGAAEKLMGNAGKNEAPPQEKNSEGNIKEAAEAASSDIHRPGNDERIALIRALMPYLSEERRHTADSLMKMMKMMKLADIGKLLE